MSCLRVCLCVFLSLGIGMVDGISEVAILLLLLLLLFDSVVVAGCVPSWCVYGIVTCCAYLKFNRSVTFLFFDVSDAGGSPVYIYMHACILYVLLRNVHIDNTPHLL